MLIFWYLQYLLPLIPVAMLARAAIMLPRRGFRARTTLWHEIGWVALALYLAAVFATTVNILSILHGRFAVSGNYNLTPFAGLLAILQSGDVRYTLLNILGNIVLFVPLGFLPPLLWRGWSIGWALLLGAGLSIAIETLQFFTSRGTDIDDVLLNTLGAGIGYILAYGFRRIAPRIANAFRLRDSKGDSPAPQPPLR